MDQFLYLLSQHFVIMAFAVGIIFSICIAPLGCFLVWKNLSYLGDSLAHSALFGIGLGIIFEINVFPATVIALLLYILLLATLYSQNRKRADALLNGLSQFFLAVGIICITKFGNIDAHDVESLFFGNILAVSWEQLYILICVCIACIVFLFLYAEKLILIVYDNDLAEAEGIKIHRIQITLVLFCSLLIALAIKTIGVLLISSLLVFPALISAQLQRSPIILLVTSSICGLLAVIVGMLASIYADIVLGPAIVVTLISFYLGASVFKLFSKSSRAGL